MPHIFIIILLLILVSPVFANDRRPHDTAPSMYIITNDPNNLTRRGIVPLSPDDRSYYVDPPTGNVYIPLAPNIVIDTKTGQPVEAMPLN